MCTRRVHACHDHYMPEPITMGVVLLKKPDRITIFWCCVILALHKYRQSVSHDCFTLPPSPPPTPSPIMVNDTYLLPIRSLISSIMGLGTSKTPLTISQLLCEVLLAPVMWL